MLKFWFVPVWSGDFRLEKSGDNSVLSVEDPTDADRRLLAPFLRTAVEMGWLDALPNISLFGRTEVPLRGTVEELGPLLVGHTHTNAKLWTAVRHYDGNVTVQEGASIRPLGEETTKDKQLPAVRKKEPMAAATVREPTIGCPAPSPADRRASEVLQTFSTTAQMRAWRDHGAMKVVGCHTGAAYWLYHRGEAAARGLGHCLVEATTSREICVWDACVPAEEEALAIKLAVEHRERWLLGLNPGES